MEYAFWTERTNHNLTLETRALPYYGDATRLVSFPKQFWQLAEEMLALGWWHDFNRELSYCLKIAKPRAEVYSMPLGRAFEATLESHIRDDYERYKACFEKEGIERIDHIDIPGHKPMRITRHRPSNIVKFSSGA